MNGRPSGRDVVLTPRKTEVVRLVAEGLSNKEIARKLWLSQRTVEAHLDQLRRQLGFHNRAQVAAWAVSRGLIEPVVGAKPGAPGPDQSTRSGVDP
jgi:DNA-binding CsgD family transcriptional regulator